MLIFPIGRICASFQNTNKNAVHHHAGDGEQGRYTQGDPGALISPHQAA
ncbi:MULTISPECIES: hypothetical protein [unclassified Limnohabitans]|nr:MULTISPECIES: hypothetical protein [unclassified Limnohabitans]